MKNVLNPLLLLLGLSLSTFVNAEQIDCYLPSVDDGEIVERLSISLRDDVLSFKCQRVMFPPKDKQLEEQVVLFHHYSHPIEHFENGKSSYLERPFSLVVIEASFDSIEFAPDMYVINWESKSIMAGTPYRDSFVTRWKCI
ncbi:hypothetical protein [uncultured Methylophaga sp.]|uniref:hypothetical protein n=1 Tax=uncultured Methylophaga sp. TaxID=285271 RepID=UPI0030FA0440